MKIKHLILAFGGASLLAACNLDEYPYGFYSEDNFYKTEADAESAVNYIYDAINYIEYSRSIVFLGDMNTDDMEPKGDAAAANKELDGWKINNFKTNTTLGNFYKYSYITINRANAVIKKVPGMNIDEGRRNRFLGEAYFMRAYSYFNLARNFGCVPVHTTPVETLEDTAVPAAESLDAMWKLVIEDFKTAGTLLPFFAAPETGRADRAAAYGMLAKAYLYIASAKEHGVPQYAAMSHDVDEYYAEAVKYAGLVVDNPEQTVFRFDDNLLDIYDVEQPTGPEHIFIMSMDRTGESEGQYSKISKMYLPYVSGATIYLKQGDSDQMVPTHDGWGEYRTALSFYDAFASGDRRHDWLIVDKVYDAAGNVVASTADGKLNYPFCRKFIDPNFSGDKTGQRAGRAGAGREGQADVRNGRHMADLAADARRSARDRPEQRLTHDAVQHPHAAMGRGVAEAVRHSGVDDARGALVERGLRSDENHDLRPQSPHRGHRRRPAGRPLRPDLL